VCESPGDGQDRVEGPMRVTPRELTEFKKAGENSGGTSKNLQESGQWGGEMLKVNRTNEKGGGKKMSPLGKMFRKLHE